MAVTILDSSGAITEDGGSYTPDATAGSNKLVLAFASFIDAVDSQTLTTHDLGSAGLTNGHTITEDAVGGSGNEVYGMAGWTTTISGSAETYDVALSTGFDNHGSVLMTVSGAHQTAPIVSVDSQVDASTDDLITHTFTATEGQLVVYMPECTKTATITAPANASNGDVWSEYVNGAIIGGTVNSGAVYTLEVSSDLTAETVVAGDNKTGIIVVSKLWIVGQASVGGATGKSNPLYGPFGGPISGVLS